MNTTLKLIGGMVALSLASLGAAQVSKQGNAYLIRMKYTKGAVYKYAMDVQSAMPKQANSGAASTMKMTAPMQMTVQKADAGKGTIIYSAGPFKVNGKANGNATKATLIQDSRGKIVGGDAQYSNVNSVPLPEKPVAIGGKWTADMPINAGMGPMTLKATYTFKGLKMIGTKQFAVLGLSVIGGPQDMMKGTGDLLLSAADGWMHSMSMLLNIATPQGFNVKVQQKVNRV